MKIALYIEDGLEQIVLTPETDTEKAILGKMTDGTREIHIRKGSFFKCAGGWVRYSERPYATARDREDESTMVVLNIPPKIQEQGSPSS